MVTVELEKNPSDLMNHKNRHQGPYKVQQKTIIKVIFYTKWREKKLSGKEKVDIMVPTNCSKMKGFGWNVIIEHQGLTGHTKRPGTWWVLK